MTNKCLRWTPYHLISHGSWEIITTNNQLSDLHVQADSTGSLTSIIFWWSVYLFWSNSHRFRLKSKPSAAKDASSGSPYQNPHSWHSKHVFILYSVVVCISLSIFTHNNKHVTKCSCPGWRMLQDVSSVYLWSCTSAFFAIEPSAAVSQGKLTSLLIALLVITECSCVKPGRYFKLTSVLSPNSQVKECSTEDQLKVLTVPHAISATSRRTKW